MTHQIVSFNFPENFPFSPHFVEVIDSFNFEDWFECEGRELFDTSVSFEVANRVFQHCRGAFIDGLIRGLQGE